MTDNRTVPPPGWPCCTKPATAEISIGTDEDGRPVVLDDGQRALHVHSLGVSGTGKSKLISQIVVSDIRRGAPVVLIDPLGTTIGHVRKLLAADNLSAMRREHGPWPALNRAKRQRREDFYSRIVIVDLAENDFAARFNPLEPQPWASTLELAQLFAAGMQMLLKAPLDQMRQLLLNLIALASIVIESEGTVADIVELCCMDTRSLRGYLRRLKRKRAKGKLGIPVRPDLVERYMGSFFANTTGKERRDLVASLMRALSLLMCDPICARLLESPKSNFRPSQAMDEGRPMLIGVPPRGLGTQAAVLSMFWSQLVALAVRRDPADVIAGRVPQVHAVIDEMQLFWTQELAEQIPIMRNCGLALHLFHQSLTQVPLHTPEGAAMIRAVQSNAGTHIVLRTGYEDAEELAGPIFRPRGMLVKLIHEEVSLSVGAQRSSNRGSSRSGTRGRSGTFTRALMRSRGSSQSQSASRSEARGEQSAETEGISASRTEGTSSSSGRSRMEGSTSGGSSSDGISASWTSNGSNSQTESHSRTEGDSWSEGKSSGTALAIAARWNNRAPATRQSLSQQSNRSRGGSASHGISASLSRANGWGETQSFSGSNNSSWSNSKSESVSQTSGTNRSRSESKSNSLSHGESFSRTVGHTESLSTNESSGTSESRSHGTSTSETEGVSEGESQGLSVGETRKEIVERHTLEEERTIRAYELASLPNREAYVVRRGGGEPEAVRMRTLDMPMEPLTRLGPLDGLADLRRLTALPPAEPPPRLGLVERLRASLGEMDHNHDGEEN